MKVFLVWAALLATLVVAVGAAVWLGGPGTPQAQGTISKAFSAADYGGMPGMKRFAARDGALLAYRHYDPAGSAGKGTVVLVHGSSATSESMHPLAVALAGAGYAVEALDIRGHGASGRKGSISYVGQLEDDVADFLNEARPAAPRTLLGFSSGGGFVLRYASGPEGKSFDRYVLLSPFLHQDAPTQREDSGGWVSVGVPRLIALQLLTSLGVTRFNDLPVLRFAIEPSLANLLTPSYDFRLEQNFRPRHDYQRDIRSAMQPFVVIAGKNDEAFFADRFAAVFAPAPGLRGVRLVPEVDHAGLVLQAEALQQIVRAQDAFEQAAPPR